MIGYGTVTNAIGGAVQNALSETQRQYFYTTKTFSWLQIRVLIDFYELRSILSFFKHESFTFNFIIKQITKMYHTKVNNNFFALSSVGFSDPSI